MSKALRNLLIYSTVVLLASIVYFLYLISVHPPSPERETFLSEIGEGVGEIALWAFIFIYLRTVIKLIMGKGPLSRRLLPNYEPPQTVNFFQRVIYYLDKTHVYFGIACVALVLIHIALMGLHVEILFFPAVLALVLWQTLFGMFLSFKYSPRDLKKTSYSVHAQLITGVAIGIFAYFGHMLLGD